MRYPLCTDGKPMRTVIVDPVTGKPYLKRWRLISTDRWGIFLHHILREDWARDPHDHPWSFFSVRLWGRYDEEVVTNIRCEGTARWIPESHHEQGRRFSWRHYGATHRVTAILRPQGVWTLILRGRRHEDERGSLWGFWTPSGWVHHSEYDEDGRKDHR